jgi:two-component system OmpR family sensor kinase
MIGTAGLIAEGNLSHRITHDDRATEVGQLGHALNVMLGNIETSFTEKEESERRLRQFVADASHELRTPLTSIRGYAELFRSGAAADPATLERVMLRIESEGERMGRLVEDLLLLARLDQGRPLERATIDLVPLVTEAVEDARIVALDHPIDLTAPDEARITGDANRLRQVIGNLLTNARVHTPPGTPVHVSLVTSGDIVTLTVGDEGQGIAPDDARHVFDRFFRADTSRTRVGDDHGSGLGLSIVASIVAAHGGHVTLDTAPGQGATFTVTLPGGTWVG